MPGTVLIIGNEAQIQSFCNWFLGTLAVQAVLAAYFRVLYHGEEMPTVSWKRYREALENLR